MRKKGDICYAMLGSTSAFRFANKATLPMQALPPGLYWVKVYGLFVGRVRKE